MRTFLLRFLLIVCLISPILSATAQGGPDAQTAYQLNLRSGPGGGYDVITVLPANTPLIVEAHNADLSWLLVHSADGAWRGWLAADYLTYADGFSAARLPASDEIVAAGQAAPVESGPAAAPAAGENGAVQAMTPIYSTDRSEYYRLTYWSDGLLINGFIGLPRQPGTHPAIIYNRGGAWGTGALIGVEIVPLVESGFVAVASQYRGNGGSQGAETFGSGDVNDVLNLIPLLQALPQVNPAKIGMMGGSRGGMVTYLALKNEALSGTRRIKAAATVGGISDLLAWAEQRPEMVEALYVPLIGATPAQTLDPFISRSAVYWPQLISAPLLLQHGEADPEVSVEQSIRLYNALRRIGKPVELATYPNDDHPLTGHLGGYPAAVDFFARQFGVLANYDAHWDAINATTQWFYQNRP
jgi:fermentation-respiration switch protein FrsA (DUF1100 family)